ncbi:MAG: hypothetical protein D3909_18915 [Candidatus Electrothrix sp. ATG1]|nr:hypothetical protein [Candidatus Electrothrix sp. ATG1]
MIIFCGSGNRAYEVQVFLDHLGMKNNVVLAGGIKVIRWMGANFLSAGPTVGITMRCIVLVVIALHFLSRLGKTIIVNVVGLHRLPKLKLMR